MRRVFGPRTVVEAAFLVAVPVAAAALGARMWTIIAASAVAYLLIFVLEATLWRESAPASGPSRLRFPSRAVAAGGPPSPPPERKVAPAPPGTAEPEPAPAAVVEPSFTAVTPSEHVRVLRPEPEPESEPEPEPEPERQPEPAAERPPLAAVPEPVPAAPEPSTVVPIGVGAGPRRWNLWDLERLTREHAGGDVARDEERQFLLMYLREFADADGLLPVDFDGLVRDSFGELVGSR
jgi:outer membrane biosynthesis protein TonB